MMFVRIPKDGNLTTSQILRMERLCALRPNRQTWKWAWVKNQVAICTNGPTKVVASFYQWTQFVTCDLVRLLQTMSSLVLYSPTLESLIPLQCEHRMKFLIGLGEHVQETPMFHGKSM